MMVDLLFQAQQTKHSMSGMLRQAKLCQVLFKGHTGYVRSVAFSSDDKQILSGSDDHSIRIWDMETGQTVLGPS